MEKNKKMILGIIGHSAIGSTTSLMMQLKEAIIKAEVHAIPIVLVEQENIRHYIASLAANDKGVEIINIEDTQELRDTLKFGIDGVPQLDPPFKIEAMLKAAVVPSLKELIANQSDFISGTNKKMFKRWNTKNLHRKK